MKFYFEKKVVGTLKNGVIERGVKESYLMRKHHAWGLDKPMIDSVPPETIIKLNSDSGKTYTSTAGEVKDKGIPDYYSGFGKQYFLHLSHWKHD